MPESTILIVDDEASIRDMVGITLDLAGFKSISAATAHEAHVSVIDNKPDLVLLDWMLPGGSGIELARRLRGDEATTNIPIIMLTAKASEDNKVQGLSEGVDDYVTKPFSPKELTARIKALLRRTGQPEDGELNVAGLKLDLLSHKLYASNKEINIGPTEFKLLELFMRNPNRAFERSQLLDRVWGRGVYVEERTVDVHVLRLRKLLRPTGNDHLIETVRGIGYRLAA